jgi:cytochrome c-type biogenesis protein CcmE
VESDNPTFLERLKAHGRLVAAAMLIVGAMVYFVSIAFQESTVYYFTVDEVLAQGPSTVEKSVRVNGIFLPGSFSRDSGSSQAEFVLTDPSGPGTIKTVYDGIVPDLFFNEHSQVVAEGRYQPDGRFHADLLIVKCPSKYASKEKPA